MRHSYVATPTAASWHSSVRKSFYFPIIHSFIHSFISVQIPGFLFCLMDYNLVILMLKLFPLSQLVCVFSKCSDILWGLPKFSATKDVPGSSSTFPFLHFSEELRFLLVMVFGNQGLDGGRGHCYRCVVSPALFSGFSQEIGVYIMYLHTHTQTHSDLCLYVFLYLCMKIVILD